MKKNAIYKTALAGLLAALTTVATYFPLPIPIAHGYVNLGDCLVILSGVLLGPVYGFGAAAVGSCLADLFSGFGVYAPATFIIKGAMALTVGLLVGKTIKSRILALSLSALLAETVMVLGYLCYELILYGTGAVASVPANCLQGIFGAVSGIILSSLLLKSGLADKINRK